MTGRAKKPPLMRRMAFWWLLKRFAKRDSDAFIERSGYRRELAEPIQVAHSSLTKLSSESDYKANCPVCADGILLVYRDQETLRLRRDDRCISCAQRFVYTDDQIGGEALP